MRYSDAGGGTREIDNPSRLLRRRKERFELGVLMTLLEAHQSCRKILHRQPNMQLPLSIDTVR